MTLQRVDFTNESSSNEIQCYLVFKYHLRSDDTDVPHEQELSFLCGEDLMMWLNHFYKEEWDELLSEDILHNDSVSHAYFSGVRIRAKNDKATMHFGINEYRKHAHIFVDTDVINDINKDKMTRILSIINE